MSGATPIDPRERVRDPRISCQTAPPRPARSGHARTRRSVAEPRRSTRRGRHPARRGVCDHPRRAAAALPATRERRGARNVPGSLGTRRRACACTRRARDSDARRWAIWSALGVAPGGIGDTCARLTGLGRSRAAADRRPRTLCACSPRGSRPHFERHTGLQREFRSFIERNVVGRAASWRVGRFESSRGVVPPRPSGGATGGLCDRRIDHWTQPVEFGGGDACI